MFGTLNFASVVDPIGKVHIKRASAVLRKRFQVLDRDVQVPTFPDLRRTIQYWLDPLIYGRIVLWRGSPRIRDVAYCSPEGSH